LIAAAALCWGAAATFGKAAFNGSIFAGHPLISPVVLSQTRTTFSALLLAAFLLVRFGPQFFRIGQRDLGLCFLVGTLGVTGSNFFYYFAVQKATVAIAIILQYTAPVWVLLYMVARGRQKATFQRVIAVAVVLAGIILTNTGFKVSALGAASAMLASFSFAFYNIAAQGLVERHHPLKIMVYVVGSSALFWTVANPPWRLAAQNFVPVQWLALFLFACISMLLPYLLYFIGLKYLDPTRAVVTACLEPVFAILFAAIFVHEGLHLLQTVGIVAVLAATVMIQLQGRSAPLPEVVSRTGSADTLGVQ
jgi:drug/metabolite transporter (DMT)-like permease